MATFTVVTSFINPWDAYIAKGRLEVEGIPVVIVDEYYIWLKWMYSQAWGGVKLQVLAANKEKANEILTRHFGGEYENALSEVYPDIEVTACPKCESRDYRISASIMFSSLSVLLLSTGYILPPVKDRYKCNQCRHSWKLP